ncbi:MAG: hypothetical protein ACYSTL_07300, partial [Planctomycetota bacterium]
MPFRTIKNLGVGGLALIIFVVVVLAYRNSEQALRSLRESVELYAPIEASLDEIGKHIDASGYEFKLYSNRDRISAGDISDILSLLERRSSSLSERLGRNNRLAEIANARAKDTSLAFSGYVSEEREDPSGAMDSAMQLRERVASSLLEVQTQLAAIRSLMASASQLKEVEPALDQVSSLAAVAEQESYRYFNRNRFSFDDVT